MIKIRKAQSEDFENIARCLWPALSDLLNYYISENASLNGQTILKMFIEMESNQYSYQNCVVAVDGDKIVGAINAYKGSHLQLLRQPIINYFEQLNLCSIEIEPETTDGEYYIDSIGIIESYRGKGIAGELIKHIQTINVKNTNLKLGLLVDPENDSAIKLYTRLGFENIGFKKLLGKKMYHMQSI